RSARCRGRCTAARRAARWPCSTPSAPRTRPNRGCVTRWSAATVSWASGIVSTRPMTPGRRCCAGSPSGSAAPKSISPRRSGGRAVHSEAWSRDSVVCVTDEGEDRNGLAPGSVGGLVTAVMALNVPDVDALWERAVAAGCEVVYPLADQFYGDRAGRLRDPFGHQWMLSTHIEDVDRDEIDRRMQAWSEQQG